MDIKKTIIKLLILGIILLLFHPGDLLFVALIVIFLFIIAILILLFKDYLFLKKCVKKQNNCTKALTATIVTIKREPDVDFDYIKFNCKSNDVDFSFISDRIIETRRLNVGDKVTVYVEPENYRNYYIEI